GAEFGAQYADEGVADREALAFGTATGAVRREIATAQRVSDRCTPHRPGVSGGLESFARDGLDPRGPQSAFSLILQRRLDRGVVESRVVEHLRGGVPARGDRQQQVFRLD